jgi:flagellin
MSVVNTNVKALFAQEASRVNELSMNKSMERLSTGLRINSAKDDAAGLAITNNMTAQIRGMAVAVRNANDGISMSQTAEGAYGEVENMLQRMRELAVQAANGAMSDDDRASLQLEVDELKAQIDSVADTTNFNNIKLLDGSARNVALQVGTKEGDSISIGFDSAKTTSIGQGSQVMLQSAGGAVATFGALGSGDLLINGVDVGISQATDDTASSADAAASAIAKAAAINRVSDQTGVYAKALETRVHGYAGTMASAVGEGTITINGVSTVSIYTSTDEAYTRASVVEAINRISGQTGVRAINTNDDNLGVQLVADDGRNIVHSLTQTSGSFTDAVTGLGAAATTVGTFGLYTLDGRDIEISHSLAGSRTDSGLAAGTYQSDTATYTSRVRGNPGAGSAPTSGDAGVLNGDTLVLNGVSIRAASGLDDRISDETTGGSSVKSASAIAIAAAINERTAEHGVTATAAPNVLRGESFTAAALTSVYLNGVTITTSLTNYTIDDVVNLFNDYSDRTGVTASNFNGALELRAEDGRNVSLGSDAANTALGLGNVTIGTASAAAAITHYSRVTLSSDSEFTVKAGAEGYLNFSALGFREGVFGGESEGMKVSEIDITSEAGASQSLSVIDAAITQISSAQARTGAFQNRLDYVVSNLSEASQNMSASRSRIMDADYATETTELARAQIIQQAATAMLAQANQSAQGVLALLQ